MAEIAHILPAAVLANPPEPVLTRAVEDYAKEIGTTKRTIYRWRDIARAAKDPVPLDDPAKMRAWWSRNMTHKIPDYLNDWVSRAKSTPPVTVPGATNISPAGTGAGGGRQEGEQPDRSAIDIGSMKGHGLERAVVVLKQNVEACSQLLSEAYKDPNDQRLSQYQRRFEDAVEQLRKAENSLIALQKARGDLAPRTEFRSDLVTIALGLRGMLRRRADNICSLMSGHLTPEQLGHLRAALIAEGQRDEKLLRTSRFWTVAPDGTLELPAA